MNGAEVDDWPEPEKSNPANLSSASIRDCGRYFSGLHLYGAEKKGSSGRVSSLTTLWREQRLVGSNSRLGAGFSIIGAKETTPSA